MFRCIFTKGTGCSDTSTAAKLTVCGEVTLQPISLSVTVNSPIYFATAYSDPSATFQWQLATVGPFGDLYNGVIFTGVKTDTLNITSISSINNGQKFRCIITTSNCSDTTETASLLVAIGIDEELKLHVKLYPNPTNVILTISIPSNHEEISYAIINAPGQEVLSGRLLEENTSLDVSLLATGIYTLRLGNGMTKSVSIVS